MFIADRMWPLAHELDMLALAGMLKTFPMVKLVVWNTWGMDHSRQLQSIYQDESADKVSSFQI